MGRPARVEGVVLRSFRFGEADRIVHLYTPEMGRIGVIAKGIRKATSRFGGRLEPFFRDRIILHVGRGELATVTGVETLDSHSALRQDLRAMSAAALGANSVLRLLDSGEPNRAAYNLLCRYLGLLDEVCSQEGTQWLALVLAFRMKLLIATGFAPQLGLCAACGRDADLEAYSPAAGGAVCASCREGASALTGGALTLMRAAVEQAMVAIAGSQVMPSVLAEVDRALVDTAAYHANVRLRRATADPVLGMRSQLAGQLHR